MTPSKRPLEGSFTIHLPSLSWVTEVTRLLNFVRACRPYRFHRLAFFGVSRHYCLLFDADNYSLGYLRDNLLTVRVAFAPIDRWMESVHDTMYLQPRSIVHFLDIDQHVSCLPGLTLSHVRVFWGLCLACSCRLGLMPFHVQDLRSRYRPSFSHHQLQK